jgi:hypothetical protein
MRHLISTPIPSAFFVALMLLVTQTSVAQLSSQDVAQLRTKGEAKGWTFTVGETAATALPSSVLCGLIEPPDWRSEGPFGLQSPPAGSLPSRFDWRDWGGCTPIRNQGNCMSCWAFGAMGPVESFVRISTFNSLNFSEQWLISCTYSGSCSSGGWYSYALNYLSCGGWTDPCGASGAVLEADFPYVAEDTWCYCPYSHPYCIPGWYYVGSGSGILEANQIKQAILDHGPVVAGVAVLDPFFAYTGGVFNACEWGALNHAIVLVGWDDNQGTNGVWFLRNGWGTNWGEDNGYGERGYMRIEYGCCRVGSAAAYVNYDAQPLTPLPFTDAFATTTIEPARWYVITNAEINTKALGEPSAPNSLNLKGSALGGDNLSTACIDTTALGNITLTYSYERTGGGDSPEAGDDLVVEYLNNAFQWVELGRQSGSGADMTSFASASHTISATSAKHRYFRIRFRVTSSAAGNDDWFIDDVSVAAAGAADQTPPSPNPMSFSAAPAPDGISSITMAATTATDAGSPPVQYFFDFVSGGSGGTDSGWQSGTVYTDTGLAANTEYTYRVKARDSAATPNETAFSATVSATTMIETPTGIAFGAVTANSIALGVANSLSNLTAGQSGVFFDSLTPGGDGGIHAWIKVPTATATGLTPNTTYSFTVGACNQDGVQTAFCNPASRTTLAAVPGAPILSNPSESSLRIDISPNGNPTGTEFAIQCTDTSPYDSNWENQYVNVYGYGFPGATWGTLAWWGTKTVYGLNPSTRYTFCVKARNRDGVETALSYSSSLTTNSSSPSPSPSPRPSPRPGALCGLGTGLGLQSGLLLMLLRLGRRKGRR